MNSAPAISVVVPTRDRPAQLARCLSALTAQESEDLEIVVVDDGSRDRGALERALHAAPAARLVRAPGRGPAAARNLGVHAATGEIVCLTDDDCEPAPDWTRLLAAHARAGLVAGGRTVAPAGASAPVRASQAITNHLQLASIGDGGALGFAPTCNMAARRDVLVSLPFDAGYPTAAGEDRDWWSRLIAGGGRGVYEDRAIVVHRQELNVRTFLRQQRRYGEGAARYRRGDPAGRRLAHPSFYAGLLRAGFAAGPAAGALVVAAQAATAMGVASGRRRA